MERRQRAEILQRFGAEVKRVRQRLGLSQEKLAFLSGLDRTYVGGVERGERNLGLVNVVRIAEALRVQPAALVEALGVPEDA